MSSLNAIDLLRRRGFRGGGCQVESHWHVLHLRSRYRDKRSERDWRPMADGEALRKEERVKWKKAMRIRLVKRIVMLRVFEKTRAPATTFRSKLRLFKRSPCSTRRWSTLNFYLDQIKICRMSKMPIICAIYHLLGSITFRMGFQIIIFSVDITFFQGKKFGRVYRQFLHIQNFYLDPRYFYLGIQNLEWKHHRTMWRL